jgi:hypothetical protein
MSEIGQTGSLDLALAHAGRLLASDPRLAAAQAAEILDVVHGHPPALLVLAASHNALGRHQDALEILAPLATSQPRWAMAQLEWGRALAAPIARWTASPPCGVRSCSSPICQADGWRWPTN